MERKIIDELVKWKNSTERKPLILRGVRQCGKTWALNEFGKRNYEDIAYFNFEEDESLKTIFDMDFDTNRIIFELGLSINKMLRPSTTLIVFDEIQECSRAITSLKYFNEKANEYHIACAGSLLGVALSKSPSFPVGKVNFLDLYPMSFTEFLIANNEEMMAKYLLSLTRNTKIVQPIENKLDIYLKQYFITGGMPEVVQTWIDTKDIEKVEKIQQMILDSYNFDFSKHAPLRDVPKISAIWKSIPEQLAKENKKFIFGQVKQGYRARELEDSLIWLENAGLVHRVYRISKPFMPLSSYSQPNAFKLYMCDIGLLRKLSKLPYSAILDVNNNYTEFKGAMNENFVLSEIIKGTGFTPYYWTSESIAEVDFVTQCNENIVPIEVKSAKNVKSRSLSEYRKKYNPKYSVKTSLLPEIDGDYVIKIPLYIISNIGHILK